MGVVLHREIIVSASKIAFAPNANTRTHTRTLPTPAGLMSRKRLQIWLSSPHTTAGHCWHVQFLALFSVCFSSFCFFLNDFSHFDCDNDNYLYLFFREIIYSVSSSRLSQMTLFSPSQSSSGVDFDTHSLTVGLTSGPVASFDLYTLDMTSMVGWAERWILGHFSPPNSVQFLRMFSPRTEASTFNNVLCDYSW